LRIFADSVFFTIDQQNAVDCNASLGRMSERCNLGTIWKKI
jgi:hypothetical protein